MAPLRTLISAIACFVEDGTSQQVRQKRWPAVFNAKGLESDYTHKGQAAKGLSEE